VYTLYFLSIVVRQLLQCLIYLVFIALQWNSLQLNHMNVIIQKIVSFDTSIFKKHLLCLNNFRIINKFITRSKIMKKSI